MKLVADKSEIARQRKANDHVPDVADLANAAQAVTRSGEDMYVVAAARERCCQFGYVSCDATNSR